MDKKLERLTHEIKSVKEGSLLARLFRKTIMDVGLKKSLPQFINRYINEDPKNSRVKVLKKKTKSSLINNIVSEEITWSVFVDLLFNVLRVRKFTFTIKLYHANGEVAVHAITALNPNAPVELKDIRNRKHNKKGHEYVRK